MEEKQEPMCANTYHEVQSKSTGLAGHTGTAAIQAWCVCCISGSCLISEVATILLNRWAWNFQQSTPICVENSTQHKKLPSKRKQWVSVKTTHFYQWVNKLIRQITCQSPKGVVTTLSFKCTFWNQNVTEQKLKTSSFSVDIHSLEIMLRLCDWRPQGRVDRPQFNCDKVGELGLSREIWRHCPTQGLFSLSKRHWSPPGWCDLHLQKPEVCNNKRPSTFLRLRNRCFRNKSY